MELAIKVNEFARDYDPYGYYDAFFSEIEGLMQFRDELASGGEGTIEWLQSIIDEGDYEVDKAKELLNDVLHNV